jgi:hypothetical protein
MSIFAPEPGLIVAGLILLYVLISSWWKKFDDDGSELWPKDKTIFTFFKNYFVVLIKKRIPVLSIVLFSVTFVIEGCFNIYPFPNNFLGVEIFKNDLNNMSLNLDFIKYFINSFNYMRLLLLALICAPFSILTLHKAFNKGNFIHNKTIERNLNIESLPKINLKTFFKDIANYFKVFSSNTYKELVLRLKIIIYNIILIIRIVINFTVNWKNEIKYLGNEYLIDFWETTKTFLKKGITPFFLTIGITFIAYKSSEGIFNYIINQGNIPIKGFLLCYTLTFLAFLGITYFLTEHDFDDVFQSLITSFSKLSLLFVGLILSSSLLLFFISLFPRSNLPYKTIYSVFPNLPLPGLLTLLIPFTVFIIILTIELYSRLTERWVTSSIRKDIRVLNKTKNKDEFANAVYKLAKSDNPIVLRYAFKNINRFSKKNIQIYYLALKGIIKEVFESCNHKFLLEAISLVEFLCLMEMKDYLVHLSTEHDNETIRDASSKALSSL